jgi:hypothetical protein
MFYKTKGLPSKNRKPFVNSHIINKIIVHNKNK